MIASLFPIFTFFYFLIRGKIPYVSCSKVKSKQKKRKRRSKLGTYTGGRRYIGTYISGLNRYLVSRVQLASCLQVSFCSLVGVSRCVLPLGTKLSACISRASLVAT